MGTRSGEAPIKKRSPGRPPASEAVAHKESIFNAATAVFLERGFASASVAEIAKRSGASRQTLYSLFRSKSALFEALMHRYLDSSVRPADFAVFDSSIPVKTILHKVGNGAIRGILNQQRQDFYRLIVEEADQFPDLAAEFWQRGPARARAELTRLFDSLVGEKLLEIDDTSRAADQFLGSLLWAPLVRFTLRLDLPFESPEDIDLWVHGAVKIFLRAHQPNTQSVFRGKLKRESHKA